MKKWKNNRPKIARPLKNPHVGRNILEFCNVLGQVRIATSKANLDI